MLDTNVLLVSISRRSHYHRIFQSFEEKQYSLLVITDILNEYEEIIGERMSPLTASAILDGFQLVSNVAYITKHFRFRLITADPDDDKFVDCAVAGNADFIVSNDHHFDILSKIEFPKIRVISADAFLEMLNNSQPDLFLFAV